MRIGRFYIDVIRRCKCHKPVQCMPDIVGELFRYVNLTGDPKPNSWRFTMKYYRLTGREVAIRHAIRSVKRQRIPVHIPWDSVGKEVYVHRCVHLSWIRRIAGDFGLRVQMVDGLPAL